jgi:hypothetical protein
LPIRQLRKTESENEPSPACGALFAVYRCADRDNAAGIGGGDEDFRRVERPPLLPRPVDRDGGRRGVAFDAYLPATVFSGAPGFRFAIIFKTLALRDAYAMVRRYHEATAVRGLSEALLRDIQRYYRWYRYGSKQ